MTWVWLRSCLNWKCTKNFSGKEQNERDVLEALGDYKCDAGMSVENVSALVNIRALKGRCIAHKFSGGWVVGVVKSVEKKKRVLLASLQSSII
jgi:hypothetical protein